MKGFVSGGGSNGFGLSEDAPALAGLLDTQGFLRPGGPFLHADLSTGWSAACVSISEVSSKACTSLSREE